MKESQLFSRYSDNYYKILQFMVHQSVLKQDFAVLFLLSPPALPFSSRDDAELETKIQKIHRFHPPLMTLDLNRAHLAVAE